jgi:hypothetical protein
MKNPRTRPSNLDNPMIDIMPRIVMWWPSRPPAPIGYSRPPGIVTIPGTRKLERLEENLEAVDLTVRSLHRHSICSGGRPDLEMKNRCICCTFRSDLIRCSTPYKRCMLIPSNSLATGKVRCRATHPIPTLCVIWAIGSNTFSGKNRTGSRRGSCGQSTTSFGWSCR